MDESTGTSSAPTALDIAIIGSEVERTALASATRRFPLPVRVRELTPDGSAPHVVMISLDALGSQADAVVERQARAVPTATIVALSTRPTPELVMRTMRAGAAEVLALPLDEPGLAHVLGKAAAVRDMSVPRAHGAGHVVTMIAPKEGLGATTLVANLGVELGRAHPRRVALVDLDLRNGDLALLLNIDPPQSLADLALGVTARDAVYVHGLLVQHASGLSLLAASTDRGSEVADLTAAHVEHAITRLRETHRLVLVDAPPPLTDAAGAAARAADRVLVPTEATVPCLRATWRTLEALECAGIPAQALEVIVARYEATAEAQLSLEAIEDALGRPVRHVVPGEAATAARAINSGLPITHVRADGPLQHAIAALAATMIAADDTHTTHPAAASGNPQ